MNAYHCVCSPGFTGSNCQHRVDACDSGPCLNDGRCSSSPQHGGGSSSSQTAPAFRCSCPVGFTGRRCESFVDWCTAVDGGGPCLNGATCVQRGNQYRCLCAPGWDGLACDVPSVSCAEVAASRGTAARRTPETLKVEFHYAS